METSQKNNYTATGNLLVTVTTAGGALPIEGALVTIRSDEKSSSGVLSVMTTDQSGRTPRIALPTPPAADSESPGKERPYAVYIIEVDKENYVPRSYQNVPVFAGTTSIQPVNLIPTTEYGGEAIPREGENIVQSQNPDL